MSILGTIAFIIVFLTIGTLAAAVVTILPGVAGVPGGLVAGAMRKSAAGRLTGILIAVACQSYVALAFAAIVIESARPITGKTTGVWQWFLWALAVFLVEDEKDAGELVTLILAEYKLICARNFDEGLHAARRGYFDLYILDNWLPDGSGIGLCRLIREFDPYTAILFYSACAYARDIQEALRSGAQAYLVKPVALDELIRAVARLTTVQPETAFEARRAESAAILEELAIRQTENVARVEKAKEKYLRAEEKALRGKAQIAFLAAGGTRGDFAREWPPVFMKEVRGVRTSDAANGH